MTTKTTKPAAADPTKLGEELAAKRRTRPMAVLSGCLLVSFLCGAMLVVGIIGAIEVARLLGWRS